MNPQQQRELHQTFDRFLKRRERLYAAKINKALKSQVNTYLNARKQGYSDSDALQAISSAQLLTILKELYLDAGIVYGAKVVSILRTEKARMPIGFNQLMINLMNQYFQIDLLNVVESITGNTRDKIRDILIAAYAAGNSFAEISNELTAIGFTWSRAKLITRTETVTAANAGAHMAAGTTGLELRKTWISGQDNRTRRRPRDKYDHLNMNGQVVGYNDKFNVSGQLMLTPGDRKNGAQAGNICNCRCTVGYSGIRDANGKLVRSRTAVF